MLWGSNRGEEFEKIIPEILKSQRIRRNTIIERAKGGVFWMI